MYERTSVLNPLGHAVGDFVVERYGWHQEIFQVVGGIVDDAAKKPVEFDRVYVKLADERREMVTGRKYGHISSSSPSRYIQIPADRKAQRL